jgi:hypothetical protein
MNGCRSAKFRRREHAAAVVCALALFVALVAGSALRPHYTTNSLPEPGVWTHSVEHVQRDAAQAQLGCATGCLTVQAARGLRPAPVARKPFSYVWMTHDLPSTWAPMSPSLDWSALPKSFETIVFPARGTPLPATARDPGVLHSATQSRILRC